MKKPQVRELRFLLVFFFFLTLTLYQILFYHPHDPS